ncbi:hypothetical protein BDW62DRAFT_219052 [Aspergillus aurantiobrunneus]
MSLQKSRFSLPGFSLPVNHQELEWSLDPVQIEGGFVERLDTHREIVMRQIMSSIIDKLNGIARYIIVFDEEITTKWREEVAVSGRDFSPKMMDWVIQELQWKAGYLSETGHVLVFDGGVVISDTVIPPDLQQELRSAIAPFEMLKKDFHPGSDEKVVDLVHPSLFPVITVALGSSQIRRWNQAGLLIDRYSKKFQWMPCNVEFGEDGGCHVNGQLYQVIEKILAKTIPLWSSTLSNVDNTKRRIPYDEVVYTPQRSGSSYSKWEAERRIVQPEPGDFNPEAVSPENSVQLREKFPSGLQVIVKLANIELSPEKPEYHSGSWHVEGALNEHICATAIYYYDNENITDNSLAFRQRTNPEEMGEMGYEQDQHEFLQEVFGFGPHVEGRDDTQITQEIGGIFTKEGRLLTFPNKLQHRVSPFSLADKSKPGHRKILAFFLVDPHYRIISSANVPPQREDWWEGKRKEIFNVFPTRLPLELQNMVMSHVNVGHITMEEACQYRLEFMEERSAKTQEENEAFETGDFNLCEH